MLPEPGTLVLLIAGLVRGFAAWPRKRELLHPLEYGTWSDGKGHKEDQFLATESTEFTENSNCKDVPTVADTPA